MEISFRNALAGDRETIYGMIREAREFQREQGFVQWTDSNPSIERIDADIAKGCGWMICGDGVPFGYFYLCFDKDADYEAHPELWKANGVYGSIHRVAFSRAAAGKGLSSFMFRFIREKTLEAGIHILRIDTHEENRRMQHILLREGFEFRGKVMLAVGERVAFEQIL